MCRGFTAGHAYGVILPFLKVVINDPVQAGLVTKYYDRGPTRAFDQGLKFEIHPFRVVLKRLWAPVPTQL